MTRAVDRRHRLRRVRPRPRRRRPRLRSAGCSAGWRPRELEAPEPDARARARRRAPARLPSTATQPSRPLWRRDLPDEAEQLNSSRPATGPHCRRQRLPCRCCAPAAASAARVPRRGGCPTARSPSSSAARTASTPSASPGCGRWTAPRAGTPARARPRVRRSSETRCTGFSRPIDLLLAERTRERRDRRRRARPLSRSNRRGGCARGGVRRQPLLRLGAGPRGSPRCPVRRASGRSAFEHDAAPLHGRLDVLSLADGPRAFVARLQDQLARPRALGGDRRGDYRLQRLVDALAASAPAWRRSTRAPLPRASRTPSRDHVRPGRRARARGRALGAIARIRSGEFRPTPSEFICAGCPALDVVCAGPRLRVAPPRPARARHRRLMRIAALYDVHGNLPALEAVLADVTRRRRVVCGGEGSPVSPRSYVAEARRRVGRRRDRIRPIIERLAREYPEATIALRFTTRPGVARVGDALRPDDGRERQPRDGEALFWSTGRRRTISPCRPRSSSATLRDRVLPAEARSRGYDAGAARGVRRRGATDGPGAAPATRRGPEDRERRGGRARPPARGRGGHPCSTTLAASRSDAPRDPVRIERDLVRLVPRADWGPSRTC